MKFNYALICDDIREEINGKSIFIGVYSNDIILNVVPADLSLVLVSSFTVERVGDTLVEFEVYLGDKLLSKTKGKLSADAAIVGGRTHVKIPFIITNIEKPDKISAKYRIDGSEWVEFFTVPLNLSPDAVRMNLDATQIRSETKNETPAL